MGLPASNGRARTRTEPRPHRAGRGSRPAALSALALVLSGCIAAGADIHVPPFFSRHARGGGGSETELFFGAVRLRGPAPGAPPTQLALRPLISQTRGSGGRSATHFLVPFGRDVRGPNFIHDRTVPLYWYRWDREQDDRTRWRLISPLLIAGRLPDGRASLGLFVFGGVLHQIFSWDEVVYVLFPLYAKTTRDGRHSWHFPWPLLNYGQGLDGNTFRILPFYAHSIHHGNYERRSFLWPFFHYQRDELRKGPLARTRWLFWPFFGMTKQGTYRSYTVLWPLFGYARDTRTGFWAFDAPWPFVRVHGGGEHPPSEVRRRFWPLWSRFVNDGLESTWVLWPIHNKQREWYQDGRIKKSWFLVPFLQERNEWDSEGNLERHWFKAWPFFQDDMRGSLRRQSFPALNPFWPTPVVDDHYAWLYELYTVDTRGSARTSRSWANFYRREVDPGEDREYLLGLWSRRRYAENGEPVRETSLLFGLLRWRSRPSDRLDWLRPAFPGPGWPGRRIPPTSSGSGA